jgi:hypothetical protein
VTVEVGAWRVAADPGTGFVRHAAARLESKRVKRDVFQYGSRELPGKIFVPTVSVHASYDDKEGLSLLSLYHIRQVRVNLEVPGEAFVVGAPGGTNVVDLRKGRDRPQTRVAKQGVANVIHFMDRPAEVAEAAVEEHVVGRSLVWTAAGLTIAVAGLALMSVRRWRGGKGVSG